MSETYITRAPILHGKDDGSQVYLQPGDEVTADLVGDELLIAMRTDGRVVPKQIWDGLVKSVETQAELETAKAQAEAELIAAQSSPTATQTYEAGVAQAEFTQRVERENKKIAQEQGQDVDLDESGHQKGDTPFPVVTGSTPSPAVSALAAGDASSRETATVKEAQEIQEKKSKGGPSAQEVRGTRTAERPVQVNAESKTDK